VRQRVDWSKRAGYIRIRHGIEPGWADQAVDDEHAGANAWRTNQRDRRLYGKEDS
jgi:hypothetical protein